MHTTKNNNMEDFGKSVKTSRRSRNRNYVPTTVINPAANVLSAIEYVEGAFEDRREKVNLFQQQAEQRRIDMQNLVDDTERVDQTDAQAKMTEQFSNMVTDIYKSDIASFDGDRTDFLNKSNNAQKIIGSFPKVMGVVDELSNKYTNMNPAEQKKMILRSQFAGKDAEKRKAYMEFLNDPSKMSMRIQGKDIIITDNGKDLFNGTQLINSVKEGNSLIEYANDYEKEIGAASKDAMDGVKSLIVAKEYETMSKDGTRLSDTQLNDYMGAVNQYKENLEKSSKIDALLNESTFQRYIDGEDLYSSEKHDEETKAAMIDQLVAKEFPMYKKEVNKKGQTTESAIGDKSIKTEIVTPKVDPTESEESTVDASGFDSSASGYVDRTNTDIYSAMVMQSKTDPNTPNKIKGVTTINEKAMGSILERELSSVKGYNVDSYKFVRDKSGNTNLIIQSTSPSGGKNYTPAQVSEINKLAVEKSDGDITKVIDASGNIIDKDNFEVLKVAIELDGKGELLDPKGETKKKESKEFTVKNLNTPDGVYELEKILITNRGFPIKEKQQALNAADKIRIQENQKRISGERKQVDAQKVRSNLIAIKSDFMDVQNDKNPVILNSPKGSFETNAVDWFKSLPSDYKVRTPDGIITAEEFLKGKDELGSYPKNFLYETYMYTYEDASKNPQPGVSLNYTPMNLNENSEGELD
jgi:urease gamma subunit